MRPAPPPDLYLHRELTTTETANLLKLAQASDLYTGGHAGAGGQSSEGPFDTLTVYCCGEAKVVILVTQGNPSFEKGPRHELLALLHGWRQELTAAAEQELKKKRRPQGTRVISPIVGTRCGMIPFPRLGAIIVLVVIVLALPAPAQACGCSPVVAVPGQSRPISFDREVAIFSATVVEQSLLKGTVTLDVLQVWKGELTYLTTMQTIGFDGSATSCDWVFELGKTYLIFGYGDSIATMRAQKCTLTAPLEEAGEALAMLKTAGYRPRQPQLR